MYSRPQGSERPELEDELVRLLADVQRGDPYYYESLSPESLRYQQLCELESRGFIRYCSYPEEFWVVLPRGREFLSTVSQRRRFFDDLRSSRADAENHEPSD